MGVSKELEELREALKPMFDEQRRLDAQGYDEAVADLGTLGVGLAYIGGNCPVQAEGSLPNGREFYFRARGDAWQFHVFAAGTGPFDNDEWETEGEYGSGFDAGWMPQGEALAIIGSAVRAYLADATKNNEVSP